MVMLGTLFVILDGVLSIQDWYLRYELTAVPGVSKVASIGGFVKQYQIEIDRYLQQF